MVNEESTESHSNKIVISLPPLDLTCLLSVYHATGA